MTRIHMVAEDGAVLDHRGFYESRRYQRSYHFNGLGRPIVKYPLNDETIPEVIGRAKPQVGIETGVACGRVFTLWMSVKARQAVLFDRAVETEAADALGDKLLVTPAPNGHLKRIKDQA